ncbi:class I SAM-dependent methyltransferase [Alphaproteobacteria bacterium]|nr:class I SAM-dependent methyltransferase [Alphaproteobacteria bacterium]
MLYDVEKINAFYDDARGQMVAKLLREDLKDIWHPTATSSNLAVGFPFYFFPNKNICPVLMPVEIGGMALAHKHAVYSAVIDSYNWPVESDSVDYLLIAHALEFIEDKEAFLREVTRVLKSAGKIVILVPHRYGLWARSEKTPFGYGTSFSRGEMFGLLKNCGLQQEKCTRSLSLPPFADKLPDAVSNKLEKVGEHLLQLLGGVLIVEATKMVYAEPKISRVKIKAGFIKSQSAFSSSK